MTKLQQLAEAIKKHEGWYPIGHRLAPKGSRSYRHHNPGNLRSNPTAICIFENFAVFENDQRGMEALIWDLECKAKGRTRTRLKPTSTLQDLFQVWAPTSDGNNPDAYVKHIEQLTGFKKTMELKELLT